MTFTRTNIPDVVIIEPTVHGDSRGYFVETFRQDKLEEFLGYKINFCQDNESKSSKGVLRGLHYQLPPHAQTKLVRVIQGRVLDVAVDIRKNSPSFGKYVAVELSSDNKKQLLIPRGFAHGFVDLEDDTIFVYKVDN
ncbi:MAG: dTDP-4-dehydrorhamnose 3,5-epimerase, partial [Arcobacter sp.]|uniref:dTDP-4-dehydrorhamnose 3,5-epimerase n=1 Tax=Arcobacter sp. TaxID=1872629 RepID=UPI003D0790EF